MKLLSCALAFLLHLPQPPGGKKLQAEWAAAVKKAKEVSDIRVADALPFTLNGRIRFSQIPGRNGIEEGTYRLDWASPTFWREEISTASYERVIVRKNDKRWIKSSSPMPLAVYQLQQLIRYADVLPREMKVSAAANVEIEGKHARCFLEEGWQYCFDASEGVVLNYRYGSEGYVFQDLADWGGRRFPRVMLSLLNNKNHVQFEGGDISPLQRSSAEMSDLPENAQETCAEPMEAKVIKKALPDQPVPGSRGALDAVYVYATIDKTGRLVRPQIFRSPGKAFDQAVLSVLTRWRFRPAMCGTTPLETETTLLFMSPE
jgi:hypothetical protein